MFRSIRKIVWTHRERLLAAVMLPAFFLASQPHNACLCADGHREPFCQAALCRAHALGVKSAACCGCSCCQLHGATQRRSCCQKAARDGAESSTAAAHGLSARASTCCQPIIEAPAPAIKSNKVERPSHPHRIAFVEPLVDALDVAARFDVHVAHSSTPPPLDAVIVFHRLTI